MLKKKILFYTDCSIFGGCERPLLNIPASFEFGQNYDYKLIYRKTKIYTQALLEAYPSLPLQNIKGVYLPDINSCKDYLETKISNRNLCRLAKISASLIFRLFFLFIFIYDLIFLYFLFKKEKAQIIHINNGGYPGAASCRFAAIAARAAGIKKIIMSVHNTAIKKNGFLDIFIDFFVRKCVFTAVTGSLAAGEALCRQRGFDKKRIINIYHGIKPRALAKIDRTHIESLGNNYILMVARFEERKGHKYVISAICQLISEHPEYKHIKLGLIGDGPLLDSIKSLVMQNNLNDNVLFFGQRADYIEFVAKSLFLLNPSLGNEDLPYIILEAMSFGIPVIATNVCGIPEEIENGISGILVAPGDILSLSRAIDSLLSSNAQRVSMGEEAKKRFLNLFTIDKMISCYMNLYKQMFSCEA